MEKTLNPVNLQRLYKTLQSLGYYQIKIIDRTTEWRKTKEHQALPSILFKNTKSLFSPPSNNLHTLFLHDNDLLVAVNRKSKL